MRRATITIPDDLEATLEAYQRHQKFPPSLTAVVQAALREYLAERGYLAGREYRPPTRPFRITPAKQGDGRKNGSIEHDRIFAEE